MVELETESQKPNFWQDKEKATKISQELADLKEKIYQIESLEKEIRDLEELSQISGESLGELEEKIKILEEKIKKEEKKIFLGGKYDKGNAILSIFSGAGGQDAQDWVTLLLRMYQRYCERKGFKTKILEQSFGEAGGPEGRIGVKSVTLEIKGDYVFGLSKREAGVHRLVRISPFSSQSLRHTSFALVEVLPELKTEDEKEVSALGGPALGGEIKPQDLKIEFSKSSGPGGQNVNKRETAIRITHLPTGVVAECQSERMLGDNREKAMKILLSRLYQLRQETHQKELSKIKGEKISASWGNQIRSYVLHPYKLVKDLRTDVETSDIEAVLDGDLDKFIEAEIKLHDKIPKHF